MPDEFKLRPFVTIEEAGAGPNCIALDAKSAYAFTITSREHPDDIGLANAAHEQGARALAAAIHARIEKLCNSCGDDDAADLMGEGYDEGYLAAMTDMEAHIHRLVPPKEKA